MLKFYFLNGILALEMKFQKNVKIIDYKKQQ